MVIIKIRCILVEMIPDIDPDIYGPNVNKESKGIKQLITQCTNAINETMVEILLYYCKFCKTFKLNKFKMNPYNPCVDNWLVNILQQSKLFHVDDCKLSHMYPKVHDSFIVVLRK